MEMKKVLSDAMGIQKKAIRRAYNLMLLEGVKVTMKENPTHCGMVSNNFSTEVTAFKVTFEGKFVNEIIDIYMMIEDVEKSDEEWADYLVKVKEKKEKKRSIELMQKRYESKMKELKALESEVADMKKEIESGRAFKELDCVVSIFPVNKIPIGTTGTIVHDYGDDETFEVEFFKNHKTIAVEKVLKKQIQKRS